MICLLFADAVSADSTKNLDLVKKVYGPNIAAVYKTVNGMPGFESGSDKLPDIVYRRDPMPCNELFLRENPEMAHECSKVRETLAFVTQYRRKLQVHIKGGEIEFVDFSIPLDQRDPSKSRNVILLDGSLIVHDRVLDQYSRNHAKIYYFPYGPPVVRFDRDNDLILRFGDEDYIKFNAQNFRKTEAHGFVWTPQTTYYRNGTRSIPNVRYQGAQPYMMTANWSYPPLDGFLDLYDGDEKLGRIPTSFLYQKLKNDRARPLFKKTGLLNYLRYQSRDGSIKRRYGRQTDQSIKRMLSSRTRGSVP